MDSQCVRPRPPVGRCLRRARAAPPRPLSCAWWHKSNPRAPPQTCPRRCSNAVIAAALWRRHCIEHGGRCTLLTTEKKEFLTSRLQRANLSGSKLYLTAKALRSLSTFSSSWKFALTQCLRYLNRDTLYRGALHRKTSGIAVRALFPALKTNSSLFLVLYLRPWVIAYSSQMLNKRTRALIDGHSNTISSA